MSDVEIKKWQNELLKISLWMIRVGKEFYFFGKEFASELGYANPRKAIQDRITDPEEKKSMEEILGPNFRSILEKSLKSDEEKISLSDFFQRIHRNQKLVTEFALYHFCGTSKKEKAKPFQKWIFNAIKEIRETGSYSLPGGAVNNPLDLIAKVSSLEKEIKNLRKEIHASKDQKVKTHRKVKQTPKNIRNVKDNLRNLKREIERIENELKESLEKTNSSDSDSSSPRYYSSSSDSN